MAKRAKNAEITTSLTSRGASAVTTTTGSRTLRVTIPGTDERAAQALLVDMLKLGGSTLRKPRIKAPSTDAMERSGQSYLESADPVSGDSAVWRVRIWYRSQGDETLACDSDLMSRRAAESLASSMTYPSDALEAKVWNTTAATDTAFAEPRTSARVVTLPHTLGRIAMGEVTDSGWVNAPVATTPVPVDVAAPPRKAKSKSRAVVTGGAYYAGSPTGRPGDVAAPAPVVAVVRPRLAGAGAYSLRRAA